MDFVASADTDGDGFAERGTHNTIDQGSAAVQYAPRQTYLAVKSAAAYRALEDFARLLNRPEVAQNCRDRYQRTLSTLRTKAWLGDHYAVVLNETEVAPQPTTAAAAPAYPEGRGAAAWAEPRTAATEQGEPGMYQGAETGWPGPAEEYTGAEPYDTGTGWNTYAAPRPVSGWDGFSIYASNGLVYLLRSGTELGFDARQMRQDLLAVQQESEKLYGSPHTNNESNMWVSQNIFRDIAAAYLGLDFSANVARYWELEKYINRRKRGCFTDVYVYGSDRISLDYYPRGVAVVGLINALGGIQIDRQAKKVSVAPLRLPLRLPLTEFADWKGERVPWLNLAADPQGQVTIQVENEDLLSGIKVVLREAGAAPQPPADKETTAPEAAER